MCVSWELNPQPLSRRNSFKLQIKQLKMTKVYVTQCHLKNLKHLVLFWEELSKSNSGEVIISGEVCHVVFRRRNRPDKIPRKVANVKTTRTTFNTFTNTQPWWKIHSHVTDWPTKTQGKINSYATISSNWNCEILIGTCHSIPTKSFVLENHNKRCLTLETTVRDGLTHGGTCPGHWTRGGPA